MNQKQQLLPNEVHCGEDKSLNNTNNDGHSDASQKSPKNLKGFSDYLSEKNSSSDTKSNGDSLNVMEKLAELYKEKKHQIIRSRLKRYEKMSEEDSEKNERLKINCHSLDCHSDDAYYFPWSYYHLIKEERNNILGNLDRIKAELCKLLHTISSELKEQLYQFLEVLIDIRTKEPTELASGLEKFLLQDMEELERNLNSESDISTKNPNAKLALKKIKKLFFYFRYSLSEISHTCEYHSFIDKAGHTLEEQRTENQRFQTPCRSNSEERHSILAQQPVSAQQESQVVENHSFEDQNESYKQWKKTLKEFLALKDKMWSLGDKKRSSADKVTCKICERKIFFDRMKSHSVKCLQLQQLTENLNTNHDSMLTLSEIIFEKKLDLTVRARTKKRSKKYWCSLLDVEEKPHDDEPSDQLPVLNHDSPNSTNPSKVNNQSPKMLDQSLASTSFERIEKLPEVIETQFTRSAPHRLSTFSKTKLQKCSTILEESSSREAIHYEETRHRRRLVTKPNSNINDEDDHKYDDALDENEEELKAQEEAIILRKAIEVLDLIYSYAIKPKPLKESIHFDRIIEEKTSDRFPEPTLIVINEFRVLLKEHNELATKIWRLEQKIEKELTRDGCETPTSSKSTQISKGLNEILLWNHENWYHESKNRLKWSFRLNENLNSPAKSMKNSSRNSSGFNSPCQKKNQNEEILPQKEAISIEIGKRSLKGSNNSPRNDYSISPNNETKAQECIKTANSKLNRGVPDHENSSQALHLTFTHEEEEEERSGQLPGITRFTKTIEMLRSFTTSAFQNSPRTHHTSTPNVTVWDFDFIKPLGKGAFGKVWLVRRKTTSDLYAMKIIDSVDKMKKNQFESLKAERDVFGLLEGDFVVKALWTFKHNFFLCFVMEYMKGGDFQRILEDCVCLDESVVKFYIAEIVLAIEHLHSIKVVHRDLKPDNILLDSQGHIKLTDFGLSETAVLKNERKAWEKRKAEQDILNNSFKKKFKNFVNVITHLNNSKKNSNPESSDAQSLTPEIIEINSDVVFDMSPKASLLQNTHRAVRVVGTPDYIAPEVINGDPHNQMVDWWSLGVMVYEFLTSVPTFNDDTVEKIFDNILNHRINWPEIGYEENCMTPEAKDLIERLLEPDPKKRLGVNGAQEIKNHPWFKGIEWDKIRKMKAPIIPVTSSKELKSADLSRGAKKFNAAEIENPFAESVKAEETKTKDKDVNSSTPIVAHLLEKFEMTRNDLLHKLNEAQATEYLLKKQKESNEREKEIKLTADKLKELTQIADLEEVRNRLSC